MSKLTLGNQKSSIPFLVLVGASSFRSLDSLKSGEFLPISAGDFQIRPTYVKTYLPFHAGSFLKHHIRSLDIIKTVNDVNLCEFLKF